MIAIYYTQRGTIAIEPIEDEADFQRFMNDPFMVWGHLFNKETGMLITSKFKEVYHGTSETA